MGLQIGELVRQAKQGNRKAFQELVLRHAPQVFIIAYNIVHEHHLSEDIAQESFLKAWQKLAELRDSERFLAWLSAITKNIALAYLKKRQKDNTLQANSGSAVQTVQKTRSEKEEEVLKKFSQLPGDYQEIMLLRYVEELSYREISQRLNMTISAVGEKLCRIRQTLKAKSVERKA